MGKRNFQKGIVQEGVPLILLILVLIGVMIFLFYSIKPPPEPPAPPIVTPLPLTVTPGEIAAQTLPEAEVTLKFWTWEWVPHPSPPPEMPNLRILQRIEIPGLAMTQTTDSSGQVIFDASSIPNNVEVEVIIEKEADSIHFIAAMDPSYGAVFTVPESGGTLIVDIVNTEFAPGVPAGDYHSDLKADQAASLTILD